MIGDWSDRIVEKMGWKEGAAGGINEGYGKNVKT